MVIFLLGTQNSVISRMRTKNVTFVRLPTNKRSPANGAVAPNKVHLEGVYAPLHSTGLPRKHPCTLIGRSRHPICVNTGNLLNPIWEIWTVFLNTGAIPAFFWFGKKIARMARQLQEQGSPRGSEEERWVCSICSTG